MELKGAFTSKAKISLQSLLIQSQKCKPTTNHKALVVPLLRAHEFQVNNGVLQTKKARSSASSCSRMMF